MRVTAPVLLVGGLAAAALCWVFAPGFALGWVAALSALLGWPLGSMALLLIHGLTGGRWGTAIRGPLLVGVMLLPVALAAAIPIGVMAQGLYPWRPTLSNAWYLNLPFLLLRVAAYVVAWLGLAALTLAGALGRGPAVARIAPGGLIVLAITATFASIDLTAALDPTFSSSIYGMLTGTGMVLFALAVAILVATPGASGKGREDLAKLLLALCILWTYLDFSQFLVVWSSNLASDAPWYARRVHGFWAMTMGGMWAVHALGAVLLLGTRLRRRRGVLFGFAAAVVVAGAVRAWWLVLPEARGAPGVGDAGSMLGLGAVAVGSALLLARWPALERAGG